MLSCQSPGERQRAGSAERDPEVGTHMLSRQSPGEGQRAGNAARDSEGGNLLPVMPIPRRTSATGSAASDPQGELTCCQVNDQANVSESVARQGI